MAREEYPRPQFVRSQWLNLNGPWQFQYDDANAGLGEVWQRPDHQLESTIEVPFVYQCQLSGIDDQSDHDIVWYKRQFALPPAWRDQRLRLHFGAVDYRCAVWVNGRLVGRHEGGETPFSFDITDELVGADPTTGEPDAPDPTTSDRGTAHSTVSDRSASDPTTGEPITDGLNSDDSTADTHTITLRVEDPSRDETIPRGKQFWEEKPRSAWYTRSTGVWQTVWLEPVPSTAIDRLRFTPDVDRGRVEVAYEIAGFRPGLELDLAICFVGELVVSDRLQLLAADGMRAFDLFGPHIMNQAFHGPGYCWTPESPNLFAVTARLLDPTMSQPDDLVDDRSTSQPTTATFEQSTDPLARQHSARLNDSQIVDRATGPADVLVSRISGPTVSQSADRVSGQPDIHSTEPATPTSDHPDPAQLDRVESYFGMRKIHTANGMVYLNNRPYYQKLVLDQGYWPDGLLTAPSDESFRRDIELGKTLGFNGCRKHQKVEDPRFLYWADRLGYLVWGESGAAPVFSQRTVARVSAEWAEIIERDYNHPSIVTWVGLNESWGTPDIARDKQQQDYSLALYHLIHALDPTRLVVSNDGWEHTRSDLATIHTYAHGNQDETAKFELYARQLRNLGGVLTPKANQRDVYAEGFEYNGEPVLLSEFGGASFDVGQATGWGYTMARSPEELVEVYRRLMKVIANSDAIFGYCYTQLTDVEQEINGLATYDRRPKCDPGQIRELNQMVDHLWR